MRSAACLLIPTTAHAAVPGITGPTFNLTASADYISQPDGAMIYSWGYGCTGTPSGFAPARPANAQGPAANCPLMQLPGPTMIVNEGDTVTVNLTNALPPAAGNTSIVFPGFKVTTSGGVSGALVQEAAPASTVTTANPAANQVTYHFTATKPGTYAYYSGTQPELQIEMGLYGAIVVLPKFAVPAGCAQGPYALAATAYDHDATCYDREYLFQFSEMDSRIHQQAQAQVSACPVGPCPQIMVTIEPYHPNYFLVNGRSMPDDMDTPYSMSYIHQPYNGNPHIHPGEKLLMRVVGQGRWQHPFHFHGNHARVLARDGNLIVSRTDPTKLAGTAAVHHTHRIRADRGRRLHLDGQGAELGRLQPQGRRRLDLHSGRQRLPLGQRPAPNYGEWCADHLKPIPITPPDPQIVANGSWYAGTPYLGIQTSNSGFNSTPLPPAR